MLSQLGHVITVSGGVLIFLGTLYCRRYVMTESGGRRTCLRIFVFQSELHAGDMS